MTIVAHNASRFFGGGEIWLSILLAELQRRGHRVLLLCKNEEVAERARTYGIRAEVFTIGGDVVITDALRFAWRLRRERADAVLLTTFRKVFLGGMGARLARVPRVVARVAVSTITPRNALYRVAMRRWLDAVIVNAEEIRAGFVSVMPEAADQVITIFDGIVPPEATAPADALRNELGLPPDVRVIGTLARLERQKRIDRLLHALAALPADVHCIIAGEGPDRAKLEALATDLVLSARVHFLGFRRDVRTILDALDVFVLTSDWEGLANSMLEAMAVGVPVISTRVSGANSALGMEADGAAPGLVVDFDAAALSAALRQLLDDAALRARMGEIGRQRVRAKFDFARMVDAWEAVLV